MANVAVAANGPVAELGAGQLPTKGPAVVAAGKKKEDTDAEEQLFINEINPYEFMRHADNGTGGFKHGQYLTQHSRERNFKERRNYSYYLNFVRRIINSLTKPIFREEPVRALKGENAFWDMFLKDCDRKGHDFNHFMKKVARKAKRYGVYFVVVDNDKAEEMSATVAAAVNDKKYPYVYCYSPEDICEYEWDDLQRLSMVTFREWYKSKDGEKIWRYREWTKDSWRLYEIENGDKGPQQKLINSGIISIGEIPIVTVYDEDPDEEEDPILPHPPLYHIARGNLAVYDVCSELRELERNQGFSLMRVPVEPGKGIPVMEVGTKNAIPFAKDSSHPPDFMSPDASIPTAIMADRKFLIEQLFEMAALVGIVGMVAKAESGRAKEWEFQSSREELTRFGHVMERAEKDIVRLFGKYLGKKEMEYEVNYSENYGLVDMTAETENTSAALSLNISPEVNVEIKKDWVAKFFRDSKDELVQELLDSVDSAAIDEANAKKALEDAAAAAAASDVGIGKPAAPGEKPAAQKPVEDPATVTGAGNGNPGG